MRFLNFVVWKTGPDEDLVRAVGAAFGTTAVRVVDTWNFSEKSTGDLLAANDPPPADVYLEWLERGGDAISLQIFGPAVKDDAGAGDVGRALALALGMPLLFSDCSLFPFSYLMAREDGAILNVVIRDLDEDGFELLPSDPDDPDHWIPEMVFEADQPLPPPASEEMRRNIVHHKMCAIFDGPCPKPAFKCSR